MKKRSHCLVLLFGLLSLCGCNSTASDVFSENELSQSQYAAAANLMILRTVGADGKELIAKSIEGIEELANKLTAEKKNIKVDVQELRYSMIIRILIVGDDPSELASLANQIAEEYIRSVPDGSVRLIDRAVRPTTPLPSKSDA